jgi:hypothetical protein
MANKKISALPLKAIPAATDIIPIVDAANPNNLATKQTTVSAMLSTLNAVTQGEKGVAGGVATLDPTTGKIPAGQIPAIAINDTFAVNSQAEMLALTAEVGDVAIRADISKSFILASAPATTLSNWVELLSSGIPATNQLDGGSF